MVLSKEEFLDTFAGKRRPKSRCPVCGRSWYTGFRKRVDAVYCSRKCATRAWRQRTGRV
jgi:hypothetical protein